MPIRENARPVILGEFVTSWNGRTGVVLPLAGDYSAVDIDYIGTIVGQPVTNVKEALDDIEAKISAPVVIEKTLVFSARSFINQQPTVQDVPFQLTIGAAMGGPSDDFQIDALGAMLCNRASHYDMELGLQFGRLGNPSSSLVFGRVLINGVQVGGSVFAELDDSEDKIPSRFSASAQIEVGDIITVEIYRDSAGNNSGGIFTATSTIGWNAAPSINVQLYEYQSQ